MKPLKKFQRKISKIIDSHTREIFDVERGKLKNFPNYIIWLVYIMCLSVLLQGIADLVIKVLGYTPLLTKFPWRMDFIFLTAISVLMGYQTLIGMRRRELDVTRNSVQIGIFVELGLFVGDIYFVAQNQATLPEAFSFRMPFIILTFINILILAYIIKALELFKNPKGKWQIF